ncbi:MAG: transglycosylase SLT domain-containing protein [Deltaproteobacteria bacterium]|nr:transglycosylase SLT domain-containing protein [Deltaproteobacteria bacterium]
MERAMVRGMDPKVAFLPALAFALTACAGNGAPARSGQQDTAGGAGKTRAVPSRQDAGAASRAQVALEDAGRALESGDAARARTLLSASGAQGPESVFLGARVAAALGDHVEAARLYRALVGGPPEIEPLRLMGLARVLAGAGSFKEAAAEVEPLAGRVALAEERAAWLEKAGDLASAAAAYHAASAKAGARSVRDRLALAEGRVLLALGKTAQARALLDPLALDAASGKIMREAETALAAAGLATTWNAAQRLARAKTLAAHRAFDAALATLAPVLSKASKADEAEARWIEANVLYDRRRHYAEAVLALGRIAAGRGPHVEDAAFLAARALSRLDRDDEAVAAYRSFARKARSKERAAQARFLAARLEFFMGKEREALLSFEALVGRGKPGKSVASPALPAGDVRDAHFLAGLSALRTFKPERAALHFEAASQDAPAEALARNRYWTAVARVEAKGRGGFDLLRDLCRGDPTSWYALHARARLMALGEAPGPCRLDPVTGAGETPKVLPLEELSPLAGFLARAGLWREAAEVLHAEEQEGSAKAGVVSWIAAYVRLDAPQHAIARASANLGWPPAPRDLWRARAAYPAPYADVVRRTEERHGLPRFLVYAIARKESMFDPRAVSPVGAVGLMQMMPFVYARNAKLAGVRQISEGGVPGPDDSIRAAGFELRDLLRRFGSLPLAIMAYNGGAAAVGRWLDRSSGLPLDLFVEKAGFDQTRSYVRRVWQNLVRYRLLFGEAPPELPATAEKPKAAGPLPAVELDADAGPDGETTEGEARPGAGDALRLTRGAGRPPRRAPLARARWPRPCSPARASRRGTPG